MSELKPKRQTASKHDKATLALIQLDYVNSSFKSVSELASKYNINEFTLHGRIKRENWESLRQQKLTELANKVSEKAQSIGEAYLKNTFSRVKRYEKIIDISQQQLASDMSNGEAIPIMDCEAINDYTLAEQRIHELAKSALRIPDVRQDIDVTSKGQSIGESLLSAIAKIRADSSAPKITSLDVDRLLECEVADDNQVT